MNGPALGIVELSHIARGIVVADAALKRAAVDLFASRPISGGKHLIFMQGEVAVVEESMDAAVGRAGKSLLDRLMLPFAHAQLWSMMPDPVVGSGWQGESVAIVETSTICAAVGACDAAAKAADVHLCDMRLGEGIAGKAFFTMSGDLTQIEAARDAAVHVAGDRLLHVELIAQPASEIHGRLLF